MCYFKYKNSKIYYDIIGSGKPLIIIHGDTASSKMIIGEAKYYSKFYKVIIVDLIGQGKSERVEKLPPNYWLENGQMIIDLCMTLGIDNGNIYKIIIKYTYKLMKEGIYMKRKFIATLLALSMITSITLCNGSINVYAAEGG